MKKNLFLSLFFFILFFCSFFVPEQVFLLNKWTQFLFLISGVCSLIFKFQFSLTLFGSFYSLLFILSFFYGLEPILGIFEANRGVAWVFFMISVPSLLMRLNWIKSKEGYVSLLLPIVPISLFTILKVVSVRSEVTYWQKNETPILNHVKEVTINEPKSGVDGIECIYMINLDRRSERWEAMKPLCKSNGLHVNRFAAIDGLKITPEQERELVGPYLQRLDGGKIGCILSHLSVLSDAKKREFNSIWVLEDDLAFEDDVSLIPSFVAKLNQIDPEWDLFYTDLGHKRPNGQYSPILLVLDPRPDQRLPSTSYLIQTATVDPEILRIRNRKGTHSVIFSKKGIDKVLNYFSHVYLWTPYDRDLHYIPDIREYTLRRDVVTHNYRNYKSDTANGVIFYFSFNVYATWITRHIKDFILGPAHFKEEEPLLRGLNDV